MPHEEDPEDRNVTHRQLRLELRALKSDLRLMIIASVALNQFLANVQLPSAVSATAIVAAIVAPFAKGVIFYGR